MTQVKHRIFEISLQRFLDFQELLHISVDIQKCRYSANGFFLGDLVRKQT